MSEPKGLVIAIDGVVGSGKTSTAREVAARLGYRHLDTGAMYRALTLAAMRNGIDPVDSARLRGLLAATRIDLRPERDGGIVLLNDEDVSEAIRRPDVTRAVGAFADQVLVRRALVEQQRRMGDEGGVVAEGRDTTTVVFPRADLKIRMIADLETRARRRYREYQAKGVSISLDQVADDIRRRDAEDAARDYGVGVESLDVIELDTTGMTLDEQVEHIVRLARRRGA